MQEANALQWHAVCLFATEVLECRKFLTPPGCIGKASNDVWLRVSIKISSAQHESLWETKIKVLLLNFRHVSECPGSELQI